MLRNNLSCSVSDPYSLNLDPAKNLDPAPKSTLLLSKPLQKKHNCLFLIVHLFNKNSHMQKQQKYASFGYITLHTKKVLTKIIYCDCRNVIRNVFSLFQSSCWFSSLFPKLLSSSSSTSGPLSSLASSPSSTSSPSCTSPSPFTSPC